MEVKGMACILLSETIRSQKNHQLVKGIFVHKNGIL